VDFNVPLDEHQKSPTTRGSASVAHAEAGAAARRRLIVASHLGRPKGVDQKLSLEPAAQVLSDALGKPYSAAGRRLRGRRRAEDGEGPDADRWCSGNLRYKEEEANDPAFARALAENADVWVWTRSERRTAPTSTAGMAPFVKERAPGI
jgi:phosphoglycerate kinase